MIFMITIAIFSKESTNRQGGKYTKYLGKLTKKDGTQFTVQVHFRKTCGQPNALDCPMMIAFERKDANLAEKSVTNEDGETIITQNLWLSNWVEAGEYVDTSLDDIAD